MPLPKGYLPREGDVLVLHVKTRFDVESRDVSFGDRKIQVHVSPIGGSSYHHFAVPLEDVVGIHCRKWSEGDRVRSTDEMAPVNMTTGTVVATHEDKAWVQFDNGPLETVSANDLTAEPTPDETPLESVPSPLSVEETPEPATKGVPEF